MAVLSACTSVHHLCVWSPQRPEDALGRLELELQTGVSYRVGAGNHTQVLWKISQCSSLLRSHLTSKQNQLSHKQARI